MVGARLSVTMTSNIDNDAELESVSEPTRIYESIQDAVGSVLIGQKRLTRGLTVAILTGGHVLVEGVPGVGKTLAARLFATATGLEYGRIQMTPDVLPADITGTQVYRETTGEFEFQRGPVFANVVVADEINRATPKTQSALLESMQERTVTVGGETLSLPEPFIVIATQDPIEYEGTFALPEAQRDRFQLKLSVSAPKREKQIELLDRFDNRPELSPDDVAQSVSREQLLTAQATVRDVYVATPIKEYIIDIIEATNDTETLNHGCSPRAAISLLNVAKAEAALQDRQYVIPSDVKSLATETLAHRVVLGTDAELSDLTTNSVLEDIITETPVPENVDLASASTSDVDTESSAHGE